jgi:hypothetical protein
MAVAYSLWESNSTGVSLEAENRTGWGTLPLHEFIAGFSTDTMEDLAPLQAGPPLVAAPPVWPDSLIRRDSCQT